MIKMRVKQEGVFKMHSEDDDASLPISFTQRRHEQPPLNVNLASMIKHWRLKERVSLLLPCWEFPILNLFFSSFSQDEDSFCSACTLLKCWC